MNKIVKNALILMAITLVAGVLLGMVYEITKEPIANQEAKAKEEAYRAVFADADTFEPIYDTQEALDQAAAPVLEEAGLSAERIEEAYRAVDAEGNTLGMVMNITTSEGYGGDISFSMGIQNDGTVNGISVLTINETAGLGMKAAEEDFTSQFAAKQVDSFAYTKNGASADNEINALSGATITTNAVTNGANAGICFFKSQQEGGMLDE